MTEIKGYIIRDGLGAMRNCLTEKYTWFPHERVEEAYVHPEEKLEEILINSQSWDIKPVQLIPAVHVRGLFTRKTTAFVSASLDITGADPATVLSLIKQRRGGAQ